MRADGDGKESTIDIESAAMPPAHCQAPLLEAILDGLADGIVVADTSGRLIYVNPPARQAIETEALESAPGEWPQAFGVYRPDGVTPYPFEELPLLRAIRGQSSEQVELLVRNRLRPGGDLLSVTGRPLRDARQRLIGGVIVTRSITEQRRAEEELRQSEERFRQIAETLQEVVFLVQLDPARVLYVSPAYARVLGQSCESLYADPFAWARAIHPEDLPQLLAARNNELLAVRGPDLLAERSPTASYEYRIIRPDGELRWLTTRVTRILDAQGKPTRLVGVAEDITDEHVQREQLEHARQLAEQASRAKGEFLANMSHEIRTPMTGLMGWLDLTLRTSLTRQQRDFLSMARRSAETLLDVLNDILDFSKIEAGKLDLEMRPFGLRDCVAETLRLLCVRAYEKQLELAAEVDPQVADQRVGDATRLRQILINLVGNAIKFTDDGEVVLRVTTAGGDSDPAALRVSVRDTGVGISREQQRLIFGAFTQADSSTTRRFGGTGLGLAIASQLVQLMGGRLWVESGEGVGSTFHFEARLPLAAAAGGPRPSPLAALDGLPVLVVDDNHSSRGILERMLRQLGMRPAAVEGGEQALGALRQLAAGETPVALVLLDATLPGMDGFALARAMRLEPGLACGIVLMLSSLNEAPAAALCQELGTGHGYTVYLRKPVVEEELVAAIRGALGIGRPPGKHPEACVPTLPPLGRRRRILLAEDNSVTRRLVAEILAHRGHVVETTSDGAAAVAALEREAFDLVLMDVGMPVVDGLRATRAIRERELEQAAGRHVPILALTAHALKGDHERCLAAGMDGYISKPITVWQLLAAVEDWAGERTAPVGDAIVASPLDESVARPTSGAVDHLSDQPLSSAVRERVAGPTNKTDMESQE